MFMNQISKAVIFYFSMFALLLSGCKKDESNSASAPVINFISISPDTVIQFQDSVIIKIRYEDQDGDIGFDDPDEPVVWVKDDRLQQADLFHLPPLTPEMQNLSIQGEFYIRLKPPFLFGNGSSEQTSFSIKMRDRANNWSQNIQTTPIVIIRE
jgi:hypothetical protein